MCWVRLPYDQTVLQKRGMWGKRNESMFKGKEKSCGLQWSAWWSNCWAGIGVYGGLWSITWGWNPCLMVQICWGNQNSPFYGTNMLIYAKQSILWCQSSNPCKTDPCNELSKQLASFSALFGPPWLLPWPIWYCVFI